MALYTLYTSLPYDRLATQLGLGHCCHHVPCEVAAGCHQAWLDPFLADGTPTLTVNTANYLLSPLGVPVWGWLPAPSTSFKDVLWMSRHYQQSHYPGIAKFPALG